MCVSVRVFHDEGSRDEGVQNNHKKIVKELLRRGCDMNQQNHKGHTCLHYCFAYKYTELGDYLISKGADPSIRNSFGFTCFEGLDVQRPATSLAAPAAAGACPRRSRPQATWHRAPRGPLHSYDMQAPRSCGMPERARLTKGCARSAGIGVLRRWRRVCGEGGRVARAR